MRLFWEVTKRAFRRHVTYRAATVAGLLTNLAFGLLRAAVLLALLGDRPSVNGYTAEALITYAGLTQAVIAYLSLFGWFELMDAVHTGEVATDLLKPLDFFALWLARDLGRASVNLLLRGVSFMLLFELFFDLRYPATVGAWLAVLLAIMLSWLVSFAWRFLVNLAAFWSPQARGIGRLGFVVVWLFSGFIMPLRLFPEWAQRLARLTPFPHMIDTVVEVYLGTLSGPALVQALLVQAIWVVLLVLAGRLVLRLAVRRLVILGG